MSYQSSESLIGDIHQELLTLQSLINAVGDAIICVDREGMLVLWNPGAVRLFGFSAEEAIGASLDLIIPPESRKAHWEGFFAAMQQNHTRLGSSVIRVPMLRKNQSQFPGALTVGIVRGKDNRIERIGAIIREELEKKAVPE
ncbi:PAS domain-containing protein [Gimesia sp.]|uniref:PAS domain-containing protein n=1 Tax=Gimesia sp. TaxID=2024833 RepID=UPI003A93829E